MTHPLDGIINKIERADEHIKNLNDEIGTFVENNYRIVSNPHDDPSKSIIHVVGPEPPLRFSVMVGEIVHQLRSSLDHVIWQLVLANRKRPNRGHQFPICDTVETYKEARNRGYIKGVSRSAADLIEGCQPYWQIKRGDRIEQSKLRIIREMNNTDKHKLLMIVIAQTGGGGATTLTIGSSLEDDKKPITIVGLSPPKGPLRPSEDGTELFTMHFGEPQPHVQVTGKAPIQIAFGDCGPDLTALAENPVIHVVQQLRDRIATLVNSFSSEFADL